MVTVCPSQFATRRTLFHVLRSEERRVGKECSSARRQRAPDQREPARQRQAGREGRVRRGSRSRPSAAICSPASSGPTPGFFFSSRRRHTSSVSAFLLNRSSDLRRVRNRRQLNSLQNTWPYGYSMPIAVRYTQDAFSRSGWLWPVDAKGEPLKATSYMAVGFYVAKYVNKKSDMDLAAKGLGAK